MKHIDTDSRSEAEIREHYLLEKELASQLKEASISERRVLYTKLYDELFSRLPHHPQLKRKDDPQASALEIRRKFNLVKRYLKPDTTFVEVGPGDCHFSLHVANTVQKVIAVDVSPNITSSESSLPSNFELRISDGTNIPVPDNTASVVYSNQLMEHLHPEDALVQLGEIYRCLSPDGVYICITPSRVAGPHDISKYFSPVAEGFHLHEYTNAELNTLFLRAGFSRLTSYIGGQGYYLKVPSWLVRFVEGVVGRLPDRLRSKVANFFPVRAILGVILVAIK